MKEKKDTQKNQIAEAAKAILPQVASRPKDISLNDWSLLMLSKLQIGEISALSRLRTVPVWRGGDRLREFSFEWLLLRCSESGWNKALIPKAIASLSGSPQMPRVVDKPNLLARNIWRRSWKKDAVQEGAEVVE